MTITDYSLMSVELGKRIAYNALVWHVIFKNEIWNCSEECRIYICIQK